MEQQQTSDTKTQEHRLGRFSRRCTVAMLLNLYRILATVVSVLVLAVLAGCETTTAGGAVGVDRSQLMLVSSEQLDQLAAQSYAKLKSDASADHTLNTDRAMTRRVQSIASRIEPQTAVFRRDAPGWPWEVNVIESKSLNAFCMPGGRIMFYSGLISTLKLTDNEIAIIMGHEIAHALREHSREQLSQSMAAQAGIGAGSALFGLDPGSADLAAAGYTALVATQFSRTDETEADQIGLELSARAGFDPRAGVTLWRKMIDSSSGGAPPEFLSTHPAEASRIKTIEALLPTVLPLYSTSLE